MIRYPVVVLFALLTCALAGAQDEKVKPGTVCWPMHYAGLVAGISQDKHVVRLLGSGAYRPQEDEGVRYFVNARHTATMRVATYTDRIVGEIALEAGVNPSLSKTEISKAVSAYFLANEGFGNWHALKLGSTKQDALENLGEPARKEGDNAWTYEASCSCEIPNYMTIYFAEDKVVRVVFSAPPG